MKPLPSIMRSASLVILSLACCSVAHAQLVPGVTATSGLGTFGSYNIANLTNGAGLSSLTLSATHSSTWQDMWIGSTGVTTGWVEFDLGSVHTLSAIGVWNYNSTISLARGVQLVDVYASQNGTNYTLISNESIPRGTAQPLAAHIISAAGVQARFIKFDILSNHGNNYTGMSEVQFEANPCSGVVAIGGTGCADSGGVVNTMSFSGCPDLGTTLTLEMNTSPGAAGPLFLLFGLSDQNWGGIVLPLDLTPFGAPGCSNYVSHEFVLGGLAPTSGQATLGLAIPSAPYIVGATSYLQFFSLDIGLNPLNLAASNYLTITIG